MINYGRYLLIDLQSIEVICLCESQNQTDERYKRNKLQVSVSFNDLRDKNHTHTAQCNAQKRYAFLKSTFIFVLFVLLPMQRRFIGSDTE